ncbi:M28 family peptidase [Marinicella gelatinilytica]|uniref:M28 family peptidase n=1 Tax=Marinicella gelatinilytica TaxID=2996017 RepID=UPI002260C706|nr:M28 family peptidase [Marinicella gelatinilytica]MCX7546207.1 M20/M25/M40 family metallo-hydrolase [Marinicella gelatinilytica]
MKNISPITLFLLIFCVGANAQQSKFNDEFLQQVAELRDAALTDGLAYDITESLTTEVGARLAGSPQDAKAVAWAQAKFKELGFDRITTEAAPLKRWTRGQETAEIISPYQHKLTITALGRTNPTPDEGINGEVVHFATLADLQAADKSEVAGKITFISERMERHKDGSGYGKAVGARGLTAQVTAEKGGIAAIIRSIGTDNNRTPHTGAASYDEDTPSVPAGALSNPDADLLVNVLKRKQPVTVKLTLTSHWDGDYTSQNVIGDMLGSEKPEEYIVIGCHLDSWDLGTGAIDDASGCGITMAAAKLIKDKLGPLKRTIRVILWANEEYGLSGAIAYHDAHKDELRQHILGGESDFGAGEIYALGTRVAESAMPTIDIMMTLLKPLGIEFAGNNGSSGADLIPMRRAGMAVFGLKQDGTDYFDYHHTANDTLDKVDPKALAQNVAAWIVVTALAAQADHDFGFGLTDKTE